MKMKMQAKIMTCSEAENETLYCAHSVDDAAKKLDVSPTTIRRAAKNLGVKKIRGRGVKGFIVWPRLHGQFGVAMAFAS